MATIANKFNKLKIINKSLLSANTSLLNLSFKYSTIQSKSISIMCSNYYQIKQANDINRYMSIDINKNSFYSKQNKQISSLYKTKRTQRQHQKDKYQQEFQKYKEITTCYNNEDISPFIKGKFVFHPNFSDLLDKIFSQQYTNIPSFKSFLNEKNKSSVIILNIRVLTKLKLSDDIKNLMKLDLNDPVVKQFELLIKEYIYSYPQLSYWARIFPNDMYHFFMIFLTKDYLYSNENINIKNIIILELDNYIENTKEHNDLENRLKKIVREFKFNKYDDLNDLNNMFTQITNEIDNLNKEELKSLLSGIEVNNTI